MQEKTRISGNTFASCKTFCRLVAAWLPENKWEALLLSQCKLKVVQHFFLYLKVPDQRICSTTTHTPANWLDAALLPQANARNRGSNITFLPVERIYQLRS